MEKNVEKKEPFPGLLKLSAICSMDDGVSPSLQVQINVSVSSVNKKPGREWEDPHPEGIVTGSSHELREHSLPQPVKRNQGSSFSHFSG